MGSQLCLRSAVVFWGWRPLSRRAGVRPEEDNAPKVLHCRVAHAGPLGAVRKPASQVRVLPSSKPSQTRRRGPRRPVPGRKQGAAPSDMQNSKQHKLSSAVESRRPRAPIPATVGQECFTVRHTQRLGLSVRKNAHTPTSQWESRQTAAVGASTRAPHRARRRSHRHDLISGARRRPRHRRDLLSDAAAPRQATLI